MGTLCVNKLLQRSDPSADLNYKPIIYVCSKWMDSEDEAEFYMLFTSNNQNYKGFLKYSELRNAAKRLKKPYGEFFDECKKALSASMGMPGFECVLEAEEHMPVFKLLKCQGSETLYVVILLTKISNSNHLLDAAIEIILDQAGQPGCQDAPSAATSEALTRYQTHVEESKQQEHILLNKFIALINSKKNRIEDIEKQMEEHQESISSIKKETNEKYPILPDNYYNNGLNSKTHTLTKAPSSSKEDGNLDDCLSGDN